MLRQQKYLFALLGALALSAMVCKAQDYDDEGYGNQANNNNQGGGGDDNYGGNDDGYSGNMPNYQQNVDSEGTNNSPTNYSPQGGSEADGDYENDDGSVAAAASSVSPTIVRVRRSASSGSVEQEAAAAASEPKLRVKRHGKYYIGPVYTYVKTDKHANFKWGVKHKVGKKHHG